MTDRKKLTIIVSGMAASGKDTLAKRLAEKYKLEFYVGSDALRDLAKELGYKPEGADWWDTKEGMRFLDERKRDHSYDRRTDEIMMEKVRKGNIVLTSWTLAYLGSPGIKIWLNASKETRAKRLAKRDGISIEEARKVIDGRDEKNIKLYKGIYGFTIGENLDEHYDIILDVNKLDENQVFERVVSILEEKYL